LLSPLPPSQAEQPPLPGDKSNSLPSLSPFLPAVFMLSYTLLTSKQPQETVKYGNQNLSLPCLKSASSFPGAKNSHIS
jgi:hypothetical protein